MNKIAFALLCSSSLFGLMQLNASPAMAVKLTPEQLALPKLDSTQTQQVKTPVVKQDNEFPSMRSTDTERVKQLAIKTFGCDCQSCQALASQMLLQGKLPQS
ncbi:MAG: hypothetical protein DSM106950_40080 [Stigonema ocellatum SAG 48.90 = DSM 106950]|nr:hypothetical protein [Stigonema ocellatum SAG 48.90 = DSM 106950]